MNPDPAPDDYDSPWKEILEHYFKEFIEFFFPDAYHDIDWSRDHEFLDKEFQQITSEAETGRKTVDKLARVWRKDGAEAWALIHTDIQMRRESGFDRRMYMYNYRIFDRFGVHAASFAVIGGKSAGWRPGLYENRLWGCSTRFEFPTVRLSDYAADTEALRKSENPFAVVVRAHLKTEETSGDKTRRRHEKLKLIKNLYQRGFAKQDIIHMFKFIDWMMRLPDVENQLFWEELSAYEEESKMPYITSVEKIGIEKGIEQGVQLGIEQGLERGVQKGRREALLELIKALLDEKFGAEGMRLYRQVEEINDPGPLADIAKAAMKAEIPEDLGDFIRKLIR